MLECIRHLEVGSPGDMRPAEYQSLARTISESAGGDDGLRVAVLSSSTLSFLDPYLIVECARRSVLAAPWHAPFGQFEQPVLDQSSDFWSQALGMVIVALRAEDVYPEAFVRAGEGRGQSLDELLGQCVDRVVACVEGIRSRSDAPILVANFALPYADRNSRLFDANDVHGGMFAVSKANLDLATRIAEVAGVDVWDYAGLVAARGAASWTDQRLWHIARQAISAANLPFAGEHLATTISAVLEPRAKCLVLDLDNTIWGGVAGDDGLQGIKLGDDFPGSVFKSFQRSILGLRDQGILLAIASKNDEQTAREIFDRHPEMLLQWDDFTAVRVNWEPKSQNIRQIADEIGIGIDALAFFDDNPVERAEVSSNEPDVIVIDVPGQAVQFQDALVRGGYFEAPRLSQEDTKRAGLYRDEARRKTLRSQVTSLDDFLVSLDMQVCIGDASDETIARVSQLIGKTNQFNLTTRRHSQAALQEMIDSDSYDVRWTSLDDKFGKSGIVGVTITRYDDAVASIDSFIMSCRVMNRQVEDAMLVDIIETSETRNCVRIEGEFIATAKNSMLADFYASREFGNEVVDGDSRSSSIDIHSASASLHWPVCIKRAEK